MQTINSIGAKVFLLALILGGCQSPPTKLFDDSKVRDQERRALPEDVVVLDARPDFEFSTSHAPGAISVHWQDFSQSESPFLGELDTDLFVHARRLSRYGIRPYTPVLVLGRGLAGEGEEGRLVWTLRVMGLKDVSYRTVGSYLQKATREPSPAPKEVALWKPELDESLVVNRELFVGKVMQPVGPERPVVIDVRPESEYLGRVLSAGLKQVTPDLGALNIPWTQFLTRSGEPQLSIANKLEALGITKSKLIYVIDTAGVRSAAVTVVLRDLGFAKAANFAGGYLELLSQPVGH